MDKRRAKKSATGIIKRYPPEGLSLPKRIFDPVYGFVNLTEYEFKITNTPVFQRLNRINQMGLTYLIFPSATQTRFSHSVGVLHVVDRMLDHLVNSEGCPLTYFEVILARLAALLHDIGHLPFSHAGERAIRKHDQETKKVVRPKDENEEEEKEITTKGYGEVFESEKPHETISGYIVRFNSEIKRIIARIPNITEKTRGKKPLQKEEKTRMICDEIARIITGNSIEHPHIKQLIHNELDADRIDYLLRDSFFTGVSYGKIELHSLIKSLTWKREYKTGSIIIGIRDKSRHIIEHFLLSKYVFATQILKHPRITYLDIITQSILFNMIGERNTAEDIPFYSYREIIDKITSPENMGQNWHDFLRMTDGEILHALRKTHIIEEENYRKKRLKHHNDVIKNEHIRRVFDAKIDKPFLEAKKFYGAKKQNILDKKVELRERIKKKISGFCHKNGLNSEDFETYVDTIEICEPTHALDSISVISPDEERRISQTDSPTKFADKTQTAIYILSDACVLIAYIFLNKHYPPYKDVETRSLKALVGELKPLLTRSFDECYIRMLGRSYLTRLNKV